MGMTDTAIPGNQAERFVLYFRMPNHTAYAHLGQSYGMIESTEIYATPQKPTSVNPDQEEMDSILAELPVEIYKATVRFKKYWMVLANSYEECEQKMKAVREREIPSESLKNQNSS